METTALKRWALKAARLLPLLIIASMLLAACGTEATPTPSAGTGGASATTAPITDTTSSTSALTDTTTVATSPITDTLGAAQTQTAEASRPITDTQSGGTGAAMGTINYPKGSGEVTLWDGYTGAEADTLQKAVDMLTKQNPDFKVTLLAVPFDQLQNKYTTDASTGGGPDLLIGPSDWVGQFADANLVAPLDGVQGVSDITSKLLPSSLDVVKYNDKMWAIPANMKNVALYYNTDLVKTVPANTDEMLTMASSLVAGNVKYGLALNTGFYASIGYNFAFGGKLFTDPKHVNLTTQGTYDWLNWMAKARNTAGVFAKSGADSDIDNLFKTGAAAMVINGPWALGDYQKALGADKVTVAIAPSTPSGGKFAPFVGTENYYVNASSKNQAAAISFIAYITSAGVQQTFVDSAGQISTNTGVDLSKQPQLTNFVNQAKQGTPFPNFPGMGQVWTPGGVMIDSVVDGKAKAEDAAKKAQDDINNAIANTK